MKEQMFKAEMLNQKLQQLEQELGHLDQQAVEIRKLLESLDEFENVGAGEELLVPLARGIFAKAISTADKKMRVNVGDNTVVEKTIPEVKDMLGQQLSGLESYQQQIHSQFNAALEEMQKLQKEFE